MDKKPDVPKPKIKPTLIALLCILGIAALEVGILFYLAHGPWHKRLGMILQIMAIYGIGLGFIARSDILSGFGNLAEELTSPHPLKFLKGNFRGLSILFGTLGVGLDTRRLRGASTILSGLGQLLLLLLFPIVIIYSILHIFVILPIAYIGYLISSSITESILGAGSDALFTLTSDKESTMIKVKDIIKSNRYAVKSFIIGIPATILSVCLKFAELFWIE